MIHDKIQSIIIKSCSLFGMQYGITNTWQKMEDSLQK